MGFQISALGADQFSHLIGLDDESLAEHHARRMQVQMKPGYPCRVTLEDAEVVHGNECVPVLEKLLEHARIDYLHIHNAKPGCYAARVDRF